MRFHFTHHAKGKFKKTREAGFKITQTQVKKTVKFPLKREDRFDGTFIATSLVDRSHVLRVVYKLKGDIIVIITFYPGRRKAYEV